MPAEHASDSLVIEAAAVAVAEAAMDVESYPVWAKAVKGVTVRERDGQGRAAEAEFRSASYGFRVRYVLRYDYSDLPESYSWVCVEGDLRRIDGGYRFERLGDARTKVTYTLVVDFGRFPIPRFVIRRAESLVMSLALKELKAYVED
jgi:ribosome-associated toxin RatA of RatAB toxin-antitoxin module